MSVQQFRLFSNITDATGTKNIKISPGGTAGTRLTLASVQTADTILTFPDTAGNANIVADSAVQTITNKTITDGSNNVAADSIKSATGLITVAAASAPTAGQVLTASSGTSAAWQTPSGGIAGPGVTTPTAIVRWGNATGTSLLNSSVTLDASGAIIFNPVSSVKIGSNAAANVTTGTNNIVIGDHNEFSAEPTISVSASNNIFMGNNIASSGIDNGFGTLVFGTESASGNVIIGGTATYTGRAILSTGNNNTLIGYGASVYYTSSNNIVIGNGARADQEAPASTVNAICIGSTLGQSNTTTIGTTGTQTAVKLAGVYGNSFTSGGYQSVYIASDGLLGVQPVGQSVWHAEIDFTAGVVPSFALVQNIPTQVAPATTLSVNKTGTFTMPSDGELRYVGTVARPARVEFNIGATCDAANNQRIVYNLYINGILTTRRAIVWYDFAGHTYNISYSRLLTIQPNDILSVWMTNTTSSTSTLILNYTLTMIMYP